MPIFKLIITLINLPRLLFHILFFYMKKSCCEDDVKVALNHRHYSCGLTMGFCYLLVFDKCFRNLFYQRIGKMKYFIWYWLPPHSTFFIGTYMPLGKGFLGVHPFSTYINAKSVGDYFVVRNDVTIGEKNGGRPTILNNVTINVNSVVIGNITIGNNAIVGAGSVVIKDVPDNAVVVGNPARVVKYVDK